MKSIKFLAALAIPAMFAACTNEEIVSEKPQQLNEVVGAELIGTDVSIKAFDGVDSRLNSEGWQTTDKLGVAWIVNGDYDSKQFIENGPNNNKWVANHMFVAEDGKLVTKGNIYKGWHFAYFPFKYTETISEQTFDINPAQTSKVWNGGRINDALHISTLKFLDRNSLDENYQILPEVGLMPQRVVNAIRVTTNYSGEFEEGKTLAGLGVNSVTLTVDKGYNVFSNTVKMNVKNLPQDTDPQNPVTEEEFHNKMYKGGDNAILLKNAPSNTITTDVSKAGFVTGEVGNLYTLTISESTDKLTNDGVKIQVNVDGGYFLVEYTDKPEAKLTNEEKLNNDAIIALKEAYATGGEMTKVGKNLILNVHLYNDIFHTDFDHISNLEDWKEAVDLVTKLGRDEKFGITDVIEFTERSIPMPEGYTITVKTSDDATVPVGLKVPAKKTLTNWPAGLTSNVDVINEGTITNATGINGTNIVNKGALRGITGEITSRVVNNEGTITLTKTGALTNVNNEDGRINVVYGSKVTTNGGANNGIIAYTIGTTEYAYKLNNLMGKTSGQTSSANVNTLVINSGKTLNLGLKDSDRANSDDPYFSTGGAIGATLASLENINIELNGGEIVGVETNNVVNNVIMNGGIVNGVSINGTLEAVSGTVTSNTIKGAVVAENTVITAETIENNVTLKGENTINGATISGNVTVETGTTTLNDVQINGTLEIKAGASVVMNSLNTMNIGNIINSGELVANNNIVAESVTLNPQSSTTLTDKPVANKDWNKTIYYKTSYTHDRMTLNGTVMMYGEGNVDAEGKTVALSQGGLENALKATGVKEIKLAEGEYTFPSNKVPGNVTIICEEGTTFTGTSGLDIKGATVVGATFSNPGETAVTGTIDGTFKNCKFEGNNSMRWSYAKAGKTAVFENCEFNATSVYAIHYDGTAGADILYKNCKITGWVAIAGGHNSLVFDGCEIYGNGTYGVIRTYGDTTIKDCTFDVKNVNSTDVYQDGIHAVNCKITVQNCVNVNGNIEDIFNVSGTGEIVVE